MSDKPATREELAGIFKKSAQVLVDEQRQQWVIEELMTEFPEMTKEQAEALYDQVKP